MRLNWGRAWMNSSECIKFQGGLDRGSIGENHETGRLSALSKPSKCNQEGPSLSDQDWLSWGNLYMVEPLLRWTFAGNMNATTSYCTLWEPGSFALCPWSGIQVERSAWWLRSMDTPIPPETSWLQVLSIRESSPRDLRLNAKTQLHSTTSKLQCWTPHAKQLARQEHNATH